MEDQKQNREPEQCQRKIKIMIQTLHRCGSCFQEQYFNVVAATIGYKLFYHYNVNPFLISCAETKNNALQ